MSPATDLFRRLNDRRGAILPVLFLLMGLIAVVGYALLNYLERSFSELMDEDVQIEAQMLASDIKELGKYMLLYEKVQFQKRPLDMSGTRRQNLEALWGQSFGNISSASGPSLINACGGYSALVVFIGDLKVDGESVFCPSYLRNSQLSGPLLEKMLLENWATPNKTASVMQGFDLVSSVMADVVKQRDGNPGRYVVTIDLTGGVNDWMNSPGNFVFLNFGQKIATRLKQLGVKAELSYEIMTDSKGFIPTASERFVKVSSTVSFRGVLRKTSFTDSESFVMTVPTIKDFAIFIPYPTRSDGVPTSQWSEAVSIAANSVINGRVYFNGNIDLGLDQLPTFTETVFISGGLTSNITADAATLDKFKKKFQKGIVTNFSASRFLMDGACAVGSGASKIPIINQSGVFCERNGVAFNIARYIENLQSICSNGTAVVDSAGRVQFDFTGVTVPDPMANQACNAENIVRFVSGGATRINVNGPFAFIASPVAFFNVTAAGSSIYGIVMGGNIRSSSATNFYSLAAMKVGLPGIGNAPTLLERSNDANIIYEGVAAPLMNFPLIQSAKDAVN